jgi:hypothetical protein
MMSIGYYVPQVSESLPVPVGSAIVILFPSSLIVFTVAASYLYFTMSQLKPAELSTKDGREIEVVDSRSQERRVDRATGAKKHGYDELRVNWGFCSYALISFDNVGEREVVYNFANGRRPPTEGMRTSTG